MPKYTIHMNNNNTTVSVSGSNVEVTDGVLAVVNGVAVGGSPLVVFAAPIDEIHRGESVAEDK